MIHHATAALAQKNGIILTEQVEARTITAFKPSNGLQHVGLEGEKAKDVLSDMLALAMIRAEFGSLQPQRGEEGDWAVEFDETTFTADRLQDVLEQVQSHAEDQGLDIEAGDEEQQDEDEEKGASVVPAKYRREYAERGNPNHCGDWLAEQLEVLCNQTDEFDLDLYRAILDCNDVKHDQFVMTKPSDRGRMRMSTGLTLRRRIAVSGVLVVPATGDADDQEIPVPESYRARFMPKAKEAGTKQRKKAA